MPKLIFKNILLLNCIVLLTACQTVYTATEVQDGPPKNNINISKIPNAKPKVEPLARYGNPPSYQVYGKTYYVKHSSKGYHARGIASWYGTKFHKQRTSSGVPYNMFAMTAAHKTLPLPTYVRVTNLDNQRQIVVKVNDRGPFHANRIIDLSYAAAKKLGITQKGTGLVEVDAIDPRHPNRTPKVQPLVEKKPELYLQVGAFSDESNAEQFAKKISALVNKPTEVNEGRLHGKPIYRVQIGPLIGVGNADRATKQIKLAGLGDAIALIQ